MGQRELLLLLYSIKSHSALVSVDYINKKLTGQNLKAEAETKFKEAELNKPLYFTVNMYAAKHCAIFNFVIQ